MVKASLLVLVLFAATAHAQYQPVPVHKPSTGVSAFLVAPDEGMSALPAGWTREETPGYAVSLLARKILVADASAAPLSVLRQGLPASEYRVAILANGNGRARLAGNADWVKIAKGNRFEWTDLGQTAKATGVTVEVAAESGLQVAGFVMEGNVLPEARRSVDAVNQALQDGKPVTLVLLGDSVSENAKGMRGGASNFEKGTPGLLRSWVAGFGTTTEYLSHRDPPDWPDTVEASAGLHMLTNYWRGSVTVRDGRVPRTGVSAIVNLSKGGAASKDAWLRFPDEFLEPNEWLKDPKTQKWVDTASKAPLIVRYGLSHYQPDLVIINFGCNDANGAHIGWTAADYTWWIKVLVTQIRDRLGAAVVLSTPHLWTRGAHQHPHTQPLFALAARDYCTASGTRLADAYNEYRDDEFDSIHPGDTGHQHLFDAYRKAIQGIASTPARTSRTNASAFVVTGNVVLDHATKLMWAKDATATPLTNLNAAAFGGHSDWRLPTRDEVMALVNHRHRYPALPAGHPFANVSSNILITGTTTSGYTWFVDLGTGTPYYPTSSNVTGAVWPVRASEEK
jgi:hypothetical protein